MTDAARLEIKDIIAAANPCNACTTALRGTCESLGRCDTRDAWRQVEREVSLMEAVCEAAAAPVYDQRDDEDEVPMDTLLYRWQTNLAAALAALTAYRERSDR